MTSTTQTTNANEIAGMVRLYLRLGTVKQTDTAIAARRRILESLAAQASSAVAGLGF